HTLPGGAGARPFFCVRCEMSLTEGRELESPDHAHGEEQVAGVVTEGSEAVPLVEPPGRVVDRIDLDGPNPDSVGQVLDPAEGVDEQFRPEPPALHRLVHG